MRLLALSMILLMAPAAYHRIVYAGEDASEFLSSGGMMVTGRRPRGIACRATRRSSSC